MEQKPKTNQNGKKPNNRTNQTKNLPINLIIKILKNLYHNIWIRKYMR